MSVLVLAHTTVNPDAPEALAAYLATTQPLLDRAGAEIEQRYTVTDSIVGTAPARMVTLVRYPDRAAVDTLFQSAEYETLREIRERAFCDYIVTIVEE